MFPTLSRSLSRRSVLAALAAAATLPVSACGAASARESDAARKATLEQASGDFIFIAHAASETYKKWTDRFFETRYPKVKPQIEVTSGLEPYMARFVALIASGTTVDFMLNHESRAQALAFKGAIVPLDAYKARAPFYVPESELFTTPVPTLSWKGKVYAWPNLMASHGVYYNKTLFERARVPFPSESWTWNDLAEAAQRLTSSAPGQPEVWGWPEWQDPSWPPGWYPLLRAHGGDHFDKDQTRSLMNEKGGIATLEYMQSLWCRRRATPEPALLKEQGGTDAVFKLGAGAMKLGSAGHYRTLFNDAKGKFDWGVVAQPAGPSGRFIRAGGSSWSIPKTSRLPDLAWEYLRFQVSDAETVREIAQEQGSAVAHVPTFEKYVAPAGEMAPWAEAWKKAYVEGVLKHGTSPNYSRVGTEYTPVLGEELTAMARCSKPPREVAESITARTTKLLAEAR